MKTEIIRQTEMKPGLSGLALLRNVIVLLLFAAILAGIYFGSGFISSYAKSTIQLGSRMTFHWLSTGNSTAIQHYIQAWGGFKAPFVSALIMIFQSFAVPFPTFSVISANGIVFGVFGGALLSLSSVLVGAALCFYIARGIIRPLAERLVNKKAMNSLDGFADRYSVNSLLGARLVPLVPFNTLVSYVAGFTSISFRRFILASGIGQLPVIIAYSWLGHKMNGAAQIGLYAFLLAAELLVLGFTIKQARQKHIAQNQQQTARPTGSSAIT